MNSNRKSLISPETLTPLQKMNLSSNCYISSEEDSTGIIFEFKILNCNDLGLYAGSLSTSSTMPSSASFLLSPGRTCAPLSGVLHVQLACEFRSWKTESSKSFTCAFDCFLFRDFDFQLRFFNSILYPASLLSSKLFVEHNCMALLFSCTSSNDASVRTLAFACLQKFVNHLQELNTEIFTEKAMILYLIRLFKHGFEASCPRISSIITHFFARVSKLILNPSHDVYPQVMAFLCMKPIFDVQNVPEFYKLLFFSSPEHHNEEREWILTLISEAMLEPMDYRVLQNRAGIKLLLSSFSSVWPSPAEEGVHFEQPSINEDFASTSDDDETAKWMYIAASFGLSIDDSNDRREEENRELIKLCNFYADCEEPDRAADGDDDEEALPLKMFAEQGLRINYKKAATLKAPTVSSLDLTNLCRLNSRPRIASKNLAKIEEGEEENVPSSVVLEEMEHIEMAFQGSLPCNNSSQNVIKKKTSLTNTKPPTPVVETLTAKSEIVRVATRF